MGTPIVRTQGEATPLQYVFLQYAVHEYVQEERQFLANLLGAKTENRSTEVREAGLRKLKDPRKIKRKPKK